MSTTSSGRFSTVSLSATTSDPNATTVKCFPCSSTDAKASPSHLYAQQLNNSAALCIEIGHFSRAILSLQKALELNRSHKKGWKDRGQEVCKCNICTLDACIAFSENTPSEATTAFNGDSYSNNNKKRRKVCLSPKKDSAFWKPPAHLKQQRSLPQDHDNSDKENVTTVRTSIHKNISRSPRPQSHEECKDINSVSGGYIYRRPIRVSCEGHAMGSTLYLIVTFNLALAHHLQTVSSYGDNVEGRAKDVHRTLVLYELTYKWQLKLLCARDKNNDANTPTITKKGQLVSSQSHPPSCTAVTSIRFNMMIRNNLSQIHRLVGNHSKHKRCLEHLLSTVMVVTEYKSRTTMNRVISNNTKDPRHMELDGFLQNTTALILRGEGHYANAA
jgi:hypothetical protein